MQHDHVRNDGWYRNALPSDLPCDPWIIPQPLFYYDTPALYQNFLNIQYAKCCPVFCIRDGLERFDSLCTGWLVQSIFLNVRIKVSWLISLIFCAQTNSCCFIEAILRSATTPLAYHADGGSTVPICLSRERPLDFFRRRILRKHTIWSGYVCFTHWPCPTFEGCFIWFWAYQRTYAKSRKVWLNHASNWCKQ